MLFAFFKYFLISVLLTSCITLIGANTFKGPFRAEAMAFYFVHKGGPLTINFSATVDTEKHGKLLCRFYDAEENQVMWKYEKLKAEETVHLSYDFGSNAAIGIYQVRYSGKYINVNVGSDPIKSFGLMPLRCMLKATSADQFGDCYFYILPGIDSFKIHGFGVTAEVFNENNSIIGTLKSGWEEFDISQQAGKIWRISLKMRKGDYHRFGVSGMPMILCPDPATANAIKGSQEQVGDGRYFAHKFQVKMVDWIKSLKRSDLELEPFDLKIYEKEFLAAPRSHALFGGWGLFNHLSYIIRSQNIDPASPDFGKCPNSTALAVAYTLDKPYNPYFQNEVLEKRILLAAYYSLLKLTENDSYSITDSNYSGGDALGYVGVISPYNFAGNKIRDPKLKSIWANGVRRVPDRFAFNRVTCENQSSHWPVILMYTFKGSNESGYKELAADYIEGLSLPQNNPFMRTGYQQEAYGPDATYQGLGACQQAVYYRMTEDENALKGLRTVYNLFNHTVAPEPDGKKIGASNFSHRTAGSWAHRQYLGGLPLMRGVLEEAACWMPEQRVDKDAFIKRELYKKIPDSYYERVPQVCGYTTAPFSPFYHDFLFPSEALKNGKLPVEKSDDFMRNFNDEFICVRRPDYYAFAYTGCTAPKWAKGLKPLFLADSKQTYKWNQIQGLSMFWTPEYGSAMLSMNWNTDTVQMVCADLKNGMVDYPDYWSFKSSFEQKDNMLNMSWGMLNLPLTMERQIIFGDKEIVQNLDLKATGQIDIDGLYEQIPFLKSKKGFKVLFKHDTNWTDTLGMVKEVWLGDGSDNGVLICFENPVRITFGKETAYKEQKMGLLRIFLGNSFKEGQGIKLKYKMCSKKRNRI